MAEGRRDARGMAVWPRLCLRGRRPGLTPRPGRRSVWASTSTLERQDSERRLAATRDAYDEEGRRSFRVSAIRALLACVAVALVIGLYSGAHDALDVVQWIFDSVVGASVGLVVARRWVPRHWF